MMVVADRMLKMISCAIVLLTLICLTTVCETKICSGSQTDKVHLVALLETNPTPSCDMNTDVDPFALSLALAAEYVIDLVNNNQTDLGVPGVTYDLKIENICNNRSLATRQAALNIPLSVWKDQQICFSDSPDDGEEESLLLGFLGPSQSANTMAVAELLNNTEIPQVTPSATLADLNDKTKYYSLLRTTTSDAKQSKAIVDVAIEMGWSYILLVFTDDEYGKQGAADVEEYGKSQGLCFSATIEVETNPSNQEEYYKKISRDIMSNNALGIIYFGQEKAAAEMFRYYFDELTLSSKEKVFLASDGIGSSVPILSQFFKSSSRKKPKLVTIIPYSTINPDLENYVSQRFHGNRKGSAAISELISRYQTDCHASTCKLEKATDFTQQTIEAVLAILHAFKTLHEQKCGEFHGVCEKLSNSEEFYPSLLKLIRNTNINENIGNQSFEMNFDNNGDVDHNRAEPAYSLGVASDKSAESVKYEVVGFYHHNGTWKYNIPDSLPRNILRCSRKCDKCIRKTAPYVYRKRKSNYTIAFTTSVSAGDDQYACGINITPSGFVLMESFYYVMQQIREITGIDFSTLFIDTCYGSLGTHAIMNSIFKSESAASLYDVEGNEYTVKPSDFVAFLGDGFSEVSITLQTYLGLYGIPQISYSSTSTWLSDRLRYPKFLRNVPSDEEQAKFMIDIIQKNNWTNIGLIHSDTVYGETGSDLIIKYAKQNSVCISYFKSTSKSDQDLDELVKDIKYTASKNVLPRPIIVFAEHFIIRSLLRKVSLHDTDWKERGNILVSGETWGTNRDLILGVEDSAYGALTFSFSSDTYSWTTNGINHFKQFLASQKPESNLDNPVFIKFWQQYFECFFPNEYYSPSNKICDTSTQSLADQHKHFDNQLNYEHVVGKHIVMAGHSVAYAVKEAIDLEKGCREEDGSINCSNLFDTDQGRNNFFELLQYAKIPKVVGSNTTVYSPFLTSGDGKSNYEVYNLIKKENGGHHYRLVYTVTDGDIEVKEDPTYYIGGEIDTKMDVSTCSSPCSCIENTEIQPSTELPHSPVTTKAPQVTHKLPNWLLPIFSVIISCLTMLLILIITYIVFSLRRAKSVDSEHDEKSIFNRMSQNSQHRASVERENTPPHIPNIEGNTPPHIPNIEGNTPPHIPNIEGRIPRHKLIIGSCCSSEGPDYGPSTPAPNPLMRPSSPRLNGVRESGPYVEISNHSESSEQDYIAPKPQPLDERQMSREEPVGRELADNALDQFPESKIAMSPMKDAC